MRNVNNSRSRIAKTLARVTLTESDRLMAENALAKGELIADLILGAVAAIRSAMHSLERGIRAMAGSKSTS